MTVLTVDEFKLAMKGKSVDEIVAMRGAKSINTTKSVARRHAKKSAVELINSEGVLIHIKTLSVNRAWKGQRFKTEEYEKYEEALLAILPNIELPEPPYEIHYQFGFSSKAADWDNPIKPLQDILSKKYKFNDKLIFKAVIVKSIVPKGSEYFSFTISHYSKPIEL